MSDLLHWVSREDILLDEEKEELISLARETEEMAQDFLQRALISDNDQEGSWKRQKAFLIGQYNGKTDHEESPSH